MKQNKYSLLIAGLLAFISISVFGQAGTITLNQYCAAGFTQTWNINVNELKTVRINYAIDLTLGSDYFAFQDNLSSSEIVRTNGYVSGTACTSLKTGTAVISFTAYTAGNKTITIQYSADNTLTTNNNLYVGGYASIIGNASVGGTTYLSGLVGIGISIPRAKLHVNGKQMIGSGSQTAISGNSSLQIQQTASTETSMNFWQNNIAKAIIGSKPNDANLYLTNDYNSGGLGLANHSIALDINGNVGIGTTGPQYPLDVAGKIRANTEMIVTGSDPNLGGDISIVNPAKTGNGQASTWKIYNMGGSQYGNSLQFYAYDNVGCTNGGLCNNRFTLMDNGNVGIATLTPNALLQVGNSYSSIGTQTVRICTQQGGAGTVVDALHIDTQNSGNFDQGVAISMGLENVTYGAFTSRIVHFGSVSTTQGSKLQLQTHSGVMGVWNIGLLIDNLGRIGIGTTSPDELLTVNGSIHAKEVKVDLTGPLADYVFKPSYKLMPLSQVEQYVTKNSHLPEIPSADEVSKNGMNMGEMQNKLLQKVEELTLYMIEQQKEINQLKQELKK